MREVSIGLLDNLVRNVTLGKVEFPDEDMADQWREAHAPILTGYLPDESDFEAPDAAMADAFAFTDGSARIIRPPATWLDTIPVDHDDRTGMAEPMVSTINPDEAGLYRVFVNRLA